MTDTHTAANDAAQDVAKPTPDAEREPSLQDMLAEYDKQNPADTNQPRQAEERVAPQSAQKPDDAADDDEVRQWVREQRAKQQQEDFQQGVTEAVGFLREADEALSEIPERIAVGLLHAEAANNPDFALAFSRRHQAPHIWQRALKDLAGSAAQDLSSKPDPKLTADREAARASVRGTTQTRPDPDDAQKEFEKRISEMSRSEFAAWASQHG